MVHPLRDIRKVLLVAAGYPPPYPKALTLPQLAAALMTTPDLSEIEVQMQFFTIEQTSKEMVTELGKVQADVVGISVHVWSETLLLPVIREIRAQLPQATLVVGGPQIHDRETEWLTTVPEIDAVVTGEGEGPIRDIVRNCRAGLPLLGVPNVSVRTAEGGIHTAPPRSLPPFTDFSFVPSANLLGLAPPLEGRAYLETMRGCLYDCGYCSINPDKEPARSRSLESVRQELEALRAVQVTKLLIIDPIFNLNRARMVSIVQMVRELGFEGISVELAGHLIDESVAHELSQLSSISCVGLQSTNPEALRLMGRNYPQDRFLRGMELLQRYNITYKLHLICGLPGDTFEGFCRSLDQAYEFDPLGVSTFHLQVLPGSRFFREAKELGLCFDPQPPYLVQSTATFTAEEIRRAECLGMVAFKLHPVEEFHQLVATSRQTGLRTSVICQKILDWAFNQGGMTPEMMVDPYSEFDDAQQVEILEILATFSAPTQQVDTP